MQTSPNARRRAGVLASDPRVEVSGTPAGGSTGKGTPAHSEGGPGSRLLGAFEALEHFPALAVSRDRVLALVAQEKASTAEIVTAIESDVSLVISVLRLANKGSCRPGIDTVVDAVNKLSPVAVRDLVLKAPTFEFFERAQVWQAAPERLRQHAIAVQQIAGRLADCARYPHRDRLLVTALLHDVGKLVLTHAYDGYPRAVHDGARTPEERIAAEGKALGIDHAMVGGVLARRWQLPATISRAIEHHHSPDADGDAAFIRIADMLAHYNQGGAISARQLLHTAHKIGLDGDQIKHVIYDIPYPQTDRPRATKPCPLSDREVEVLRGLAKGLVYKQIAQELTLSTSTVRTHLHNIYGKLGALDRAQAVLAASQNGWLN